MIAGAILKTSFVGSKIVASRASSTDTSQVCTHCAFCGAGLASVLIVSILSGWAIDWYLACVFGHYQNLALRTGALELFIKRKRDVTRRALVRIVLTSATV